MQSKSLYFSIFGGNIFESVAEEEKVLDAFQIPLKRKPKSSCKSCYGQFYTGYDTIKRHFLICSPCSRICIDIDKVIERKKLSNTK
jgi:hypothetical protein